MQFEIPGIGQQKVTLADWKREHSVFTRFSQASDLQYTAWSELESAVDFGETYGYNGMGFGTSEKDAILNFCDKQGIKPPFWW